MATGWDSGARRALRGVALVVLGGYVVWNVWWLAHGRIPPSMLLGIFGLPAPTTGCTRSLLCLVRGNWAGSLFWNAYLLPFALLLVTSLSVLVRAFVRRTTLVLPALLGRCWIAVLTMAWAAKLFQGKTSW